MGAGGGGTIGFTVQANTGGVTVQLQGVQQAINNFANNVASSLGAVTGQANAMTSAFGRMNPALTAVRGALGAVLLPFRALSFISRTVIQGFEAFLGILGRISNFILGTVNRALAALTAAVFAVRRGILDTTEAFNRFRIQLEGITRSQQRAKELAEFVQQFARETPFRQEEIENIVRVLGLIPTTASKLTQPDFKKAREELGSLINTIQGLALINPFGVEGALIAFRNAVSGQLTSLERRLDIPAEVVASTIGATVEELKQGGPIVIRALTEFVNRIVGADVIKRLGDQLSVQISNIGDAFKIIGRQIGESGFYQEVTNTFEQLSKLFGDFVDGLNGQASRFATEFAGRISDALTQSFGSIQEILKSVATGVFSVFDPSGAQKFQADPIGGVAEGITASLEIISAGLEKAAGYVSDFFTVVDDTSPFLETLESVFGKIETAFSFIKDLGSGLGTFVNVLKGLEPILQRLLNLLSLMASIVVDVFQAVGAGFANIQKQGSTTSIGKAGDFFSGAAGAIGPEFGNSIGAFKKELVRINDEETARRLGIPVPAASLRRLSSERRDLISERNLLDSLQNVSPADILALDRSGALGPQSGGSDQLTGFDSRGFPIYRRSYSKNFPTLGRTGIGDLSPSGSALLAAAFPGATFGIPGGAGSGVSSAEYTKRRSELDKQIQDITSEIRKANQDLTDLEAGVGTTLGRFRSFLKYLRGLYSGIAKEAPTPSDSLLLEQLIGGEQLFLRQFTPEKVPFNLANASSRLKGDKTSDLSVARGLRGRVFLDEANTVEYGSISAISTAVDNLLSLRSKAGGSGLNGALVSAATGEAETLAALALTSPEKLLATRAGSLGLAAQSSSTTGIRNALIEEIRSLFEDFAPIDQSRRAFAGQAGIDIGETRARNIFNLYDDPDKARQVATTFFNSFVDEGARAVDGLRGMSGIIEKVNDSSYTLEERIRAAADANRIQEESIRRLTEFFRDNPLGDEAAIAQETLFADITRAARLQADEIAKLFTEQQGFGVRGARGVFGLADPGQIAEQLNIIENALGSTGSFNASNVRNSVVPKLIDIIESGRGLISDADIARAEKLVDILDNGLLRFRDHVLSVIDDIGSSLTSTVGQGIEDALLGRTSEAGIQQFIQDIGTGIVSAISDGLAEALIGDLIITPLKDSISSALTQSANEQILADLQQAGIVGADPKNPGTAIALRQTNLLQEIALNTGAMAQAVGVTVPGGGNGGSGGLSGVQGALGGDGGNAALLGLRDLSSGSRAVSQPSSLDASTSAALQARGFSPGAVQGSLGTLPAGTPSVGQPTFLDNLFTTQGAVTGIGGAVGILQGVSNLSNGKSSGAQLGGLLQTAGGVASIASLFPSIAAVAPALGPVGLVLGLLGGLAAGSAAEGGVVKARPGGSLINVGEGGRDEVIIPLERAGGKFDRKSLAKLAGGDGDPGGSGGGGGGSNDGITIVNTLEPKKILAEAMRQQPDLVINEVVQDINRRGKIFRALRGNSGSGPGV